MAGILTADIDAPLAATLGVVPSIDSILGGISGLVDVWRLDSARITRDTGNRVSAWTGSISGRQFAQATAARRPLYVAGQPVDFGNGAAAQATMALQGAAIGQMATGSIGLRLALTAGDETTDNQSVCGQDLDATGTGIVRLAYRYNAGGLGNFVRIQLGANQRDVDMPANAMDAMIWLTITGGQASLTVNDVAAATPITVASLNLPTLAIGGSREGTPSFAGGITGMCIAGSILTTQQRAAAEWAMRTAI